VIGPCSRLFDIVILQMEKAVPERLRPASELLKQWYEIYIYVGEEASVIPKLKPTSRDP
jgi:hypothetical protein